jgi:hypothetical protein
VINDFHPGKASADLKKFLGQTHTTQSISSKQFSFNKSQISFAQGKFPNVLIKFGM